MATLLSAWAPPLERSRMTTFVYAGKVETELVMGWVHPWVGLGWVGWVRVFLIFGGLGWVET